ncbi:MAG: Gfo/Idh/MocA family oxidoreductase [Kiritimatiellaeota bacterium]|nr:Gfo/Idh/MocA family oxidoreductase [Kiritimatiellota bacterium]
MKTVRLGVIGCGVIGSRDLLDAKACEGIEVVAAADLRVERRQWAAAQGIPRVYEDGRDLLDRDPEVEAVIIAYPASTRTAMALRAFARGKHVLTEKPVAMNAREVRTLISARGQLTAACFSARYRFGASARKAAELLNSGVLGRVRRIHVRALLPGAPCSDRVPPPWRESFCMNAGGILTNWGCYDLDYVLGVTGWRFRPELVLAGTWPCISEFHCHVAPESDAEAHYAAFILGADGAVLTIERGEFMPTAQELAWQVIGSAGSLSLHMLDTDDRRIVLHRASAKSGVTSEPVWEGKDPAPSGNPAVIADFADAVRERRPPATGLEQALVIMQITDAVYQSAQTGRAVRIPGSGDTGG